MKKLCYFAYFEIVIAFCLLVFCYYFRVIKVCIWPHVFSIHKKKEAVLQQPLLEKNIQKKF
jgi:hypothetical protein